LNLRVSHLVVVQLVYLPTKTSAVILLKPIVATSLNKGDLISPTRIARISMTEKLILRDMTEFPYY